MHPAKGCYQDSHPSISLERPHLFRLQLGIGSTVTYSGCVSFSRPGQMLLASTRD